MRYTFPTLMLAIAVALAAVVSTGAIAGNQQTFTGEYQWADGGSGELTAVFKPEGDDRWKVKFKFRFGGKSHNWSGTAVGSLTTNGTVTGTAEWGKRTWEFDATLEDGTLRGSHTETTGERRYDTGSFALAR